MLWSYQIHVHNCIVEMRWRKFPNSNLSKLSVSSFKESKFSLHHTSEISSAFLLSISESAKKFWEWRWNFLSKIIAFQNFCKWTSLGDVVAHLFLSVYLTELAMSESILVPFVITVLLLALLSALYYVLIDKNNDGPSQKFVLLYIWQFNVFLNSNENDWLISFSMRFRKLPFEKEH